MIKAHILQCNSSKTARNRRLLRTGMSALRGIAIALFVSGWSLCAGAGQAAESDLPAQPPKAEETNSLETLRTYLQLQEQIHATQLAIEENRKDANAAVARYSQALAGRLESIEQALADRRTQDLELMQSSNRMMLTVAVGIGALGLVAMVLVAFSHWRTMNRFAEIAMGLPPARGTPLAIAAPLGRNTSPVITVAAEESNARLLGAIDRLEQRIHQLEHLPPTVSSDQGPALKTAENGTTQPKNGPATADSNGAQIQSLLGKGQSLLNLDKPEEALACFEHALQLNGNHAEAYVKKGMALERLRRMDEAIQSYDRAIALDQSITIAYLYKGGLFNRLERFTEAIECYEKALHSQKLE